MSEDGTLLTDDLPGAGATENAPPAADPPAKPEGDGAPKPAEPAPDVPDSPDGYELSFSEGVNVDKELESSFRKTAHELGLSKTAASALAKIYEERSKASLAAYLDGVKQQKSDWEAQAKASPEYQADLSNAKKALALCPQEHAAGLIQVLNETNLGSHPALIRFLGVIGKKLSEPAVKGENGDRPVDPAKVLYPNHP